MTIPVLFLIGAVGLSVVLGVIVWLFSRPRKQKFGATIDSFNSDLSAMAPSRSRLRGRTSALSHSQAAKARPKPGPRPRS